MAAKKNSLLLFIFAIHALVLPQAQLILQHFTETSLLHHQQNMKNNRIKTSHYICKKIIFTKKQVLHLQKSSEKRY